MIISNMINDGFGLLSKQLKFYCWHYKRGLDSRQQQELIDILNEQYFEKLACKIRTITQSNIEDCKQQIGKLLFQECLTRHLRNQLIQLIKSDLVDIDVRLDNYGRTLLHRLAYNIDVELVKLLIDHGVNIRLRDYAGNTALHIAIQSYRNGALIFNNEAEVVQNLTSVINILLDADRKSQHQSMQKHIQFTNDTNRFSHSTHNPIIDEQSSAIKINQYLQCNLKCQKMMLVQNTQKNLVHHNKGDRRNGTICRIIGSHFSCKLHTNHAKQAHSINHLKKAANNESLSLEPLSETSVPPVRSLTNHQSDLVFSPFCPQVMEEDLLTPLIDTKNAFGRTALHYCVLVVGEYHLDHFVRLLISHGADPNSIDSRLKTPLYCLVKRAGIFSVRQRCQTITHLIESGCDDLGLAIDNPAECFNESVIKELERNNSTNLLRSTEEQKDPIFNRNSFKRIPSLKHLTRLTLIRINDCQNGNVGRQTGFLLPHEIPISLNYYVNRKILDQSELFLS